MAFSSRAYMSSLGAFGEALFEAAWGEEADADFAGERMAALQLPQ
jgi:hypothetical protein